MNREELERLLEKYYNGESSEEEELILRKFFRNEDIPEAYREEKEIFNYYSQMEKIPEPEYGFERRIIAAIDNEDIYLNSRRKRRLVISFSSIAAGLLILAGSYFFFIHRTEPRDTFTDPDIAYAETKKILYDISYRMNQAVQALEPVSKIHTVTERSFDVMNRTAKKIEKNIQTLDDVREALENARLDN